VNHTCLPKEHHLPDCASRDNQVKKGDRVEPVPTNAAATRSRMLYTMQPRDIM